MENLFMSKIIFKKSDIEKEKIKAREEIKGYKDSKILKETVEQEVGCLAGCYSYSANFSYKK